MRCLRATGLRADEGPSDCQLLKRFVKGRDEAAFEALVRRHACLVFSVCRRVLGSIPDAEDAFQATFLVLLRKASSVGRRGSLGNWLYGVAYRTALEARTATARRRRKEAQVVPPAQAQPDETARELLPLLDEELRGLPDKYRAPVVLCELEGKSRKEAARLLGWPEGTVAGRLARARVLLARRLARYGLALPACKPCDCAMTPAQVTRGQRRYRYYTCSAAQRQGWHTCPSKSVPALALERFVLEQIAAHARHVAWPTLAPAEQAERLRQLVTRIDYDGATGQVAILLSQTPPKEACA